MGADEGRLVASENHRPAEPQQCDPHRKREREDQRPGETQRARVVVACRPQATPDPGRQPSGKRTSPAVDPECRPENVDDHGDEHNDPDGQIQRLYFISHTGAKTVNDTPGTDTAF
ncbi:hypothetical protein C494_18401 [Natronorubrum bangense JCM 10635]|uniref:Uncharacterized protein n=1 Tax=Natronorubrum bangense JCM 10635 TaxID=1227500 RepID=L9W2B8_9EURY|nr:hypothetical protein C494_18401 [Natronorubrum bangense JCM 10635]